MLRPDRLPSPLRPLVRRSLRRLTALVLAAALAAAGLGGAALLLHPAPAEAQFIVNDPIHTLETVLHYIARLVEIGQKYQQIYNQYLQLARQLREIELQLQSLKKLDRYWLRRVEGVIGQVEGALSGRLIPSHVSPTVRQAWSEAYRGWELPVDWWAEEEVASGATLRTLRETLWAKHLQHRATVEHLRTLEEIKHQLQQVEGHEEALEALTTLAAFQTEAQILASLAAQTSADAATAYYSYQVNLRARQEAALRMALETSRQTPPALDARPGWGALPAWWSWGPAS